MRTFRPGTQPGRTVLFTALDSFNVSRSGRRERKENSPHSLSCWPYAIENARDCHREKK